MNKPKSYAGRTISKKGIKFNDHNQPERWFCECKELLRQLDEIPFSAVEDLKKYELNREIIINIINKCITILDAANVNIGDEIDKLNADPYEDVEDDPDIRRSMEIKLDKN